LAKNEYLMRHDKVSAHLQHSICKALGVKMTDKWYTHPVLCLSMKMRELWNQGIYTDREVTANRPVIISKNKQEKICILIHVAKPADRNVMQ